MLLKKKLVVQIFLVCGLLMHSCSGPQKFKNMTSLIETRTFCPGPTFSLCGPVIMLIKYGMTVLQSFPTSIQSLSEIVHGSFRPPQLNPVKYFIISKFCVSPTEWHFIWHFIWQPAKGMLTSQNIWRKIVRK